MPKPRPRTEASESFFFSHFPEPGHNDALRIRTSSEPAEVWHSAAARIAAEPVAVLAANLRQYYT